MKKLDPPHSGIIGTSCTSNCILQYISIEKISSLTQLSSGAPETSTTNIRHCIIDKCKRELSSKFGKMVDLDCISVDCDAISVVITTPDMTEQKKDAIKEFLLVFGSESALRCGIPNGATGHGKNNSVFSCYGNKSQHLPKVLDSGDEMVVIDNPCKIAIHSSCKAKVIDALRMKKIHLIPAKDKGICFKTDATANKPPYAPTVEAIIESCQFNSTHMIHLADFGFKLPIEMIEQDKVAPIFDKMKAMSDLGITVELAQIDIAFVCDAPVGSLLQLSRVKEEEIEEDDDIDDEVKDESVVDDATYTMYPIHPHENFRFNGKIQKPSDMRGSILLQKSDDVWGKDKTITISSEREVLQRFHIDHQESQTPTDETQSINKSNIYSWKLYSTTAHVPLQFRNKFPMSVTSMFAIGNRSITSLQTLLQYIETAAKIIFDTTSGYSFGLRWEMSIRPKHGDNLRTKGHYNDVLLHACLGIEDLCRSRKFNMKLHYIRARDVETVYLRLLSQARAMLRFRHERKFNEIYSHPKFSIWLQAHLSHLLITIGLCPPYGMKYFHKWAKDPNRYDPYHMIPTQEEDTSRKRDSMVRRITKKIKDCCGNIVSFNQDDTDHFTGYIKTFISSLPHGALKTRASYKLLSFQCKLQLPNSIMEAFIPAINELLPADKEHARQMPIDDGSEDEDEDEFVSVPFDQTHKESIPKDPISLAIYALMQISSISNPERRGFTSSLCYYILKCHKLNIQSIEPTLEESLEMHITEGSCTGEQLRNLLSKLKPGPPLRKRFSKKEYLERISKVSLYPCEGVLFPINNIRNKELDENRNKIINKAQSADFITTIKHDATSRTILRNSDSHSIRIQNIDSIVISRIESIKFITRKRDQNLYNILASTINTNEWMLRLCLHKSITKITKSSELQNIFLNDNGTRMVSFEGADTLDSLQKSKEFHIYPNAGNIREMLQCHKQPPEIIIPLVALAYNVDIVFYNYHDSTTKFFKNQNTKLITYTVEGTSVVTKKPCIIIALYQDNIYESHTIAKFTVPTSTQSPYNLTNGLGPLEGTRRHSRNQTMAVGKVQKTCKEFYSAMKAILKSVDTSYFNALIQEESDEPLGMLPFIMELCSNPTPFNGFSIELMQICPLFSLPFATIIHTLKSTKPGDWTHQMLCPFICIRFKFSFGILTEEGNTKVTYLYGYNTHSHQIQCKKLHGYQTLEDRRKTIYFVVKPKVQRPISIPVISYKCKKTVSGTLHTKYSYLDSSTYHDVMTTFNDMSVFYDQTIEEADLRPDQDSKTVTVHTHVVCNETGPSFSHICQKGINHRALILVFPSLGDESKWDTCIVHHPYQDPVVALEVLKNTLPHSRGSYTQESIKGKVIEECESGFYMILYSFLAHNVKTLQHFKNALSIILTEEQLPSKVRQWIATLINNKQPDREIPNIPPWINQIIYTANNNSTFV